MIVAPSAVVNWAASGHTSNLVSFLNLLIDNIFRLFAEMKVFAAAGYLMFIMAAVVHGKNGFL